MASSCDLKTELRKKTTVGCVVEKRIVTFVEVDDSFLVAVRASHRAPVSRLALDERQLGDVVVLVDPGSSQSSCWHFRG